jgi:type IV pilus assembly protein PilQ
MMIKKQYRGQQGFLSYLAFVFILALLCAAGLVSGVYASELTDIDISGNTIKLKADAPIKYSINKSSDPFALTIDIAGIAPGKTGGKIVPKNSSISEVSVQKIESSMMLTRIELLMTSPLSPVAELNGDTLIVKLETAAAEPAAAKQDAPPMSHTSDVKMVSSQPAAKNVTSVFFDKTDKAVELIIKGDGAMPEPVVYEIGNKVMVDLLDVSMSASMPSNIPAPFKNLKHKSEAGKARISFELDKGAKKEVFAVNDEAIVSVTVKDEDVSVKDDKKKDILVVNNGGGMVSLDFQEADVVAVIRLLGDVSGYNVVVHPDVKGKITMKLTNVPWPQALDIILKNMSLEKIVEGNVIRVATIKAFQDEKKAVADSKELFGKAEDIETKIFILNYADITGVAKAINDAKALSPRGNLSIEPKTNALIVKDIATKLNEIKSIVDALDKQTQQVLIETRIVEITGDASKALGVEWGINWRPFNWTTGVTGSAAGYVDQDTKVTNIIPMPGGSTNSLISLPAVTSTNTTPPTGFTVGFINPMKTLGLDMRLSAIEESRKGKIVSNPRIITSNNNPAKIVQGESIPYGERDPQSGQITTKFKDVAVTIEATPHISIDDNIAMTISVNKEDLIAFVEVGGGARAPWTAKISGNTNVIIKNGETIVIGGIRKMVKKETDDSVPGLSKLPLLGNLFKRTSEESNEREIIIFLTPKVVR